MLSVWESLSRAQFLFGLLQVFFGLLVLPVDILCLGVELVQRRHPGGDLHNAQLVPQNEIALRHLGLGLQRADLHLQLFDFVPNAQEIIFRLFQLPFGLFFPVTEARDACGLLKNLPSVGAAGRDDLPDAALTDNGIAVSAETGIHQEAVDVLQADRFPVDVIFALPAAIIAAGQHDLGAVGVKNMGRVVDDQRDLGKAQGIALLGAAKDHVLHFGAAQRLASLLAHDPQDGVGNIGLSGAVGSNDSGDIFFKCEPGLVREGLETLDLQCF